MYMIDFYFAQLIRGKVPYYSCWTMALAINIPDFYDAVTMIMMMMIIIVIQ